MQVTPTRMGWCRFSTGEVEGAARLAIVDGRVCVVEIVAAGAVCGRPLDAAAEVDLWADGDGWLTAARLVTEREAAAPHVLARIDAAERAEPAHRVQWGTGRDVEEAQDAMLALTVDVPDERVKPDGFYLEVAAAWREAQRASALGPGSASRLMAEANDVDRETVYAWVKEARRRGLLEPARASA